MKTNRLLLPTKCLARKSSRLSSKNVFVRIFASFSFGDGILGSNTIVAICIECYWFYLFLIWQNDSVRQLSSSACTSNLYSKMNKDIWRDLYIWPKTCQIIFFVHLLANAIRFLLFFKWFELTKKSPFKFITGNFDQMKVGQKLYSLFNAVSPKGQLKFAIIKLIIYIENAASFASIKLVNPFWTWKC